MRKLRNVEIKKILDLLDSTFFSKNSFDTSFNNKNGEITKFIYRENKNYFFVVEQPPREAGNWTTSESPGIYFTESEKYSIRNFPECRNRIIPWINRILEEITFSKESTKDQFQNIRDKIEKHAESLKNPDEPFDDKESEKWGKILDDLLKKFEKFKKENKIQQRELNELKKEIESLKKQIISVPKKTWMKAAGNKLLNIFEKIAERVSEVVIESTVKALIEG